MSDMVKAARAHMSVYACMQVIAPAHLHLSLLCACVSMYVCMHVCICVCACMFWSRSLHTCHCGCMRVYMSMRRCVWFVVAAAISLRIDTSFSLMHALLWCMHIYAYVCMPVDSVHISCLAFLNNWAPVHMCLCYVCINCMLHLP
jgi:hypothetical protein